MKPAIEKYLKYLSDETRETVDGRRELFDEAKKCSIQCVLHKIPNLVNEKPILW